MIRETWIFPIIVSLWLAQSGLGSTCSFSLVEAVLLLEVILVFLATVVFMLRAYHSALRPLFSPATMKARAMVVARKKMNLSLDASLGFARPACQPEALRSRELFAKSRLGKRKQLRLSEFVTSKLLKIIVPR